MREFIKTGLRPDFYEYFPRFTQFELVSRHSRLDAVNASLLCPYNDWSGEYNEADCDLSGILERVGIDSTVAQSVSDAFRCARAIFPWLMPAGVVNTSWQLPEEEGTWVSSPGIVALMLLQLLPHMGTKVLEVGVGTGVHAAALMLLNSEVRFTGVDPSAAATSAATRLLLEAAQGHRRDHWGVTTCRAQDLGVGDWDTIYSTCAVTWDNISTLSALSTHRPLTIQVPRPLTEEEFLSENATSWLRSSFPDYAAYSHPENFRKYMAITTYVIPEGGELLEIASLYDVTFVPFQE